MKGHRLQFAALFVAVASLLVYGAVPAFAVPPDPPTNVIAQAGNTTATVGWTPGAPNGTVTGFTVTTTGTGAPGPVTVGATKTSTSISGLTNGNAYTFTVHATNGDGNSTESASSNSITPLAPTNQCKFDSFPAVSGTASELAIACQLDVATGGGGNNYRVEDYPHVSWHQGEGRTVTTTASTLSTSAVITSSSGHFAAQDVNDVISGPGIPSNTFIKSVTTTTATLNHVVGSPGVVLGAKLTVDNTDGRTLIDVGPSTTVASASNNVLLSSFAGAQQLKVASIANFPSTGSLTVGTDVIGSYATLTYSGTTAGTPASFNNVTLGTVTGSGTKVLTGKSIHAFGLTTITSPTAHFCKALLTGCNSGVTLKNDVGRTISGTMLQHGTTITAVNSATSITISLPTIACPLDGNATFKNCNQVGISSLSNLSTSRQIKDATFPTTTKVCSNTAKFNQTDVNTSIVSVGIPAKITSTNYITAVGVGGTGCASGTFATLKNAVAAGTNPNVAIGGRNHDAPLNGDAAMSLTSELSVLPGLAAGLLDCSANSAVGSDLEGKWLNPGAFDKTSLGQPSATSITGPMIGQLDVTTGAGNPAFAGYVVLANSTNSPTDSDTAPHVDIVFPSLLTGTAVCPAPNDVGVATVFRFFGETLSQSAAGSGDVRSFNELDANTAQVTGTAYEHVVNNTGPSTLFSASGTCTISYPTTLANFPCGGQ